jgi:hypothetical protein
MKTILAAHGYDLGIEVDGEWIALDAQATPNACADVKGASIAVECRP